MNCPHCGTSLADSFSACPACGAPQNPSMAKPKAHVPKAASGVRKRSPKTQTPGKVESTPSEETAKASDEKPSAEEPAKTPEKEEAEKSKEGSETKAVPLRLRLRQGVITWLVVFALGFTAEKVVDFAFQDGPRKLMEENERVSKTLAAMNPGQVATNFYTRLTEPHGWAVYQWDAPFNAAEAERRLDVKYQRGAGTDFSDQTTTLEQREKAIFDGSTADNNPDYKAEQDKIAQYCLPSSLQFGQGGVLSMFVGGAFGLLDAYLFSLRVFLPETPPLVLFAIVSLVLTLVLSLYKRLSKEADLQSFFMLLLLLPFGVSVIGWLLWELGEGTTLAFKSILTAPMLNVVSTSAATPVVAWFSGKAAEHSLVERALEHDVIRRLMGAASKVD